VLPHFEADSSKDHRLPEIGTFEYLLGLFELLVTFHRLDLLLEEKELSEFFFISFIFKFLD